MHIPIQITKEVLTIYNSRSCGKLSVLGFHRLHHLNDNQEGLVRHSIPFPGSEYPEGKKKQ